MWFCPERLNIKWVKIIPHIIDTVLLTSGITLILLTHQYPHQQPWLMSKLIVLLAYIGFGAMALRRARTKPLRLIFLMLAITAFTYIASAALTRDPRPWTTNYSSIAAPITAISSYSLR
jgi:uncharacterized membrane protein SirB2